MVWNSEFSPSLLPSSWEEYLSLFITSKKGLDPDGSYRHYVKLNGHGEGHTRNCLMLSYNLPDWRKTLEGLHLECYYFLKLISFIKSNLQFDLMAKKPLIYVNCVGIGLLQNVY